MKTTGLEQKDKVKTLDSAKPSEEPVITYSLNDCPQKYRGMFDDIHSFAIRGELKTLEQLRKKIAPHGHVYKILHEGSGLVAFEFSFIRMPIKGFFGVK